MHVCIRYKCYTHGYKTKGWKHFEPKNKNIDPLVKLLVSNVKDSVGL